jgi:hypothetical protein
MAITEQVQVKLDQNGQSGSGAPRGGGSALVKPLAADPAVWFAELDGLSRDASSARAKSLTSR